jgi:Ras-related GTP-binding protein A/B
MMASSHILSSFLFLPLSSSYLFLSLFLFLFLSLSLSYHLSHSSEVYDSHRHERISNIIKQFKLSCSKAQSQFQGMEVRNSHFTAFIDLFTSNTYIMAIMLSGDVSTPLTYLNIAAARRHFDVFLPENT